MLAPRASSAFLNAVVIRTALLSGALAGLAGVGEVAGRAGYLTLDMSPGYGYAGIVIAMLAALNPLGVLLAALFVAGVIVGADSMSRAIGVPTYLADVIVSVSLLSMLVATMLGDPAEDRTLHGHRTECRENEPEDGVGFETLVREEPVEADGDADGREEVHSDQQAEIDPAETPAPKGGDGHAEPDEWKHHRGDGADPGHQRDRLQGRFDDRLLNEIRHYEICMVKD